MASASTTVTTITSNPAEPPTPTQTRITLTTSDPSISLPTPPGAILISTSFKRYEFSTLINTLLSPPSPIPFSILINNQLLSGSLATFLSDHGISPETTLELEYTRAILPPQYRGSFEHDDWVGAADVSSTSSPSSSAPRAAPIQPGHERILSGSHDGCVRVWDTSGHCLATSTGATAPDDHGNRRLADGSHPQIYAAKWMSPTTIVAGGMNCYVRVFDYLESDTTSNGASSGTTATLAPTLNLVGHQMPIHALSAHTPSQALLSASSDRTAMLWTTDASSPNLLPAPSSALRPQKRSKTTSKSKTEVQKAGPLTTLSSHTATVTSVSFAPSDKTVAYTASQDSYMKTWDLTSGRCVHTLLPAPSTPLLALEPMKALGLVAVGASRQPLLLDPRVDAGRAVAVRCSPHSALISGIAAAPEEEGVGGRAAGQDEAEGAMKKEGRYQFATSSFDSTVRVWDIRNTRGPLNDTREDSGDTAVGAAGAGTVKPLFRIHRKRRTEGQGKVLGVVWDRDVGVVSWGENGQVQVDR